MPVEQKVWEIPYKPYFVNLGSQICVFKHGFFNVFLLITGNI